MTCKKFDTVSKSHIQQFILDNSCPFLHSYRKPLFRAEIKLEVVSNPTIDSFVSSILLNSVFFHCDRYQIIGKPFAEQCEAVRLFLEDFQDNLVISFAKLLKSEKKISDIIESNKLCQFSLFSDGQLTDFNKQLELIFTN